MNNRIYILLIALLYCCLSHSANFKNEKRIYIVDVTASMAGKGVVASDNIFQKVKNELKSAVSSIEKPTTEVEIITFTNKIHQRISGVASNKKDLLTQIDGIKVSNGDTDIANAWLEGQKLVDDKKVNYVFLLTDGLHNTGTPKENLYNILKSWESFSNGKYIFGFYVMLTKQAREQNIRNIVQETNQLWLIESMNINAIFAMLPMHIKANIRSSKTLKLPFSISSKKSFDKKMPFTLKLESNPFYKIEKVSINEGQMIFKIKELKPIMEIPLQTKLKLYVEYDHAKYPLVFFTPDILYFTISNHGVRKVTIKDKDSWQNI